MPAAAALQVRLLNGTSATGHREESRHGVLLTKVGREILVAGYERRMLQHTKGALPGLSGSLRRHLYRQAERIASYIHDPQATWTGLSWR